jgi:predicted SnoaL-like aldol condensation-catalyzing enzyme
MRDDIAAMPNLTLEQFEGAYLAFVEAFNRGDFATAFAGLAPDCEFRTLEDLPGERVIVGRERVISFFEEVLEVLPDWHVESVRVLKATDDVFVAFDRGLGSGRGSRAPAVGEIATVYELSDLTTVRVHQYTSWEEGLRACGLDPSIAAEVRSPSGQTG